MSNPMCFDIETAVNPNFVGEANLVAFMERKKITLEQVPLYPMYSQVICVSWEGELETDIQSSCGPNESEILGAFAKVLEDEEELLGHNIKGFDIPFLAFRYLANRMSIPKPLRTAGKKPWEINHVDTFELLQFGKGAWIGLHDACVGLGIQSPKSDLTGADVAEAFRNEEWERIANYCRQDVRATREVFKRICRSGGA